jgi:hypothetical protein
VTNKHKAIFCDGCTEWIHLKCTALNNEDYIRLSADSSNWYCPVCISNIFPFNCIEDDFEFMCCLFNFSHSNKVNAELIKKF